MYVLACRPADHNLVLQESRDREIAGDRKPVVDTTTPMGEAMMRRFAAYQGSRALYSEWRRAYDLGCADAVHKVSIVKRGATFTRTVFKRGLDEEYFWRTKPQIVQEVCSPYPHDEHQHTTLSNFSWPSTQSVGRQCIGSATCSACASQMANAMSNVITSAVSRQTCSASRRGCAGHGGHHDAFTGLQGSTRAHLLPCFRISAHDLDNTECHACIASSRHMDLHNGLPSTHRGKDV